MLDAGEAFRIGKDLDDAALIGRVLAGDRRYFEALMRRYNRRVFRAARAIVRDDAIAEDVMQDAYVRAYQHLGDFEGRSSFATWLTRIAIHEALAHQRRKAATPTPPEVFDRREGESLDPEVEAHRARLREVIERAVDGLPLALRVVFLLRDVEGMTVAEAAACLDLTEDNVKVRLHRARLLLRSSITARFDGVATELFDFHLTRCDRVVGGVLAKLAAIDLTVGRAVKRALVASAP